ncbi:MAG: Fe-S cluster assembly protein SufD [Thermoanaerobaculia bacterium]
MRREAIERFGELGYPTTRQEEWRFTNVAPGQDGLRARAPAAAVEPAAIARYEYAECSQIVLVNGRFAPEPLAAWRSPGRRVGGGWPTRRTSTRTSSTHIWAAMPASKRTFVALNTALYRDGAVIHVPRGTVVERPINVINVSVPGQEPVASFPRLLFVVGESSEVTIFEQHVSLGEGIHLTCPVLEAVVGPNAKVDHYKLQRESVEAFHMSTVQVLQDRDATFSSHCLSWGGGLVRNDVSARLDGEGGHAELNGLYMVEGNQHVDNHMRLEHLKPHCTSHNLYKGILEGHSRAVFTGRIYVAEGAQKTDAIQTNRNLILSPDALCNSQPQLEIFADDVRCTHGSTVGQLDELAVFYLRSRGIAEEAAKSLLTYAFASDIVNRVRVPLVRRDLEEFLFRRLPEGEIVRQAV